jgi:REP element-mobilizing transposase RayT
MPNYRRNRVPGGTFLFTVNLLDRRSNLLVRHIDALRAAVRRVGVGAPFHIDAWVVLPDHMHCLWTLPQGDADFPGRWRAIKIAFAKSLPAVEPRSSMGTRHGERGIWHAAIGSTRSVMIGTLPFILHPLQPGQAWSRQTPGRLAAFDVSPLRRQRALPGRLDWRRCRTGGNRRATIRAHQSGRDSLLALTGGMRCAIPPYDYCGYRSRPSPVIGAHEKGGPPLPRGPLKHQPFCSR